MRITHQTRLVLQAFLDSPTEETWGFELSKAVGLSAGTIYPTLKRLEDAGWIEARWEEIDEAKEGRRRRRYYKLTGEGARIAQKVTRENRQALRQLLPGWSVLVPRVARVGR